VQDGVAHRFRQRVVVGREHAAEAHALVSQDVGVDAGVGGEPGWGVAAACVDLLERFGEAGGVAADQRFAELGLSGKVVVEAGLGEAELGGDVGIAEAVEAAALHEPFGAVEDPRCCVGVSWLSSPPHPLRPLGSTGRLDSLPTSRSESCSNRLVAGPGDSGRGIESSRHGRVQGGSR